MDFKKNNFIVVKNAISKELAQFIYDYFLLKQEVLKTLLKSRYISLNENMCGVFGDEQVPEAFSIYSDINAEILLKNLKKILEEKTKLKLIENYSYARIYKKGNELKRHKDRFSCEISTTLNIGGDIWPIFIEPNEKKGRTINDKYVSDNTKGIKVILNPGDMLVYRGNILEHWREPFEGNICCQIFLHYNNIYTSGAKENIFDKRPHLGLPYYFNNRK